jgi:hypothetical protein
VTALTGSANGQPEVTEDLEAADEAELRDLVAAYACTGMQIPVVASAADLDLAVRFADSHPQARWYVVKRAGALGAIGRIPESWDELYGTHIEVEGQTWVLEDRTLVNQRTGQPQQARRSSRTASGVRAQRTQR